MARFEHFAIDLHACDAQPGDACSVDRTLPQAQFLRAERIAGAGFGTIDNTVTNRTHYIRLAAWYPTRCIRRRQSPVPIMSERRVDLNHCVLLLLVQDTTETHYGCVSLNDLIDQRAGLHADYVNCA